MGERTTQLAQLSSLGVTGFTTEHLWQKLPQTGYYTLEVDWKSRDSSLSDIDFGLAWWSGISVPAPAAIWLLVIGTLGLPGSQRRRS